MSIAGEALVIMAISLNSNWKVPCGYFLINGMTGVERPNLINQCLLKLYDVGVLVKNVTFDGPSCYFSMMEHMGIQLSPPLVKTWFAHSGDSSVNVYVILDACRMLKLIRNCFAAYGILVDE